MLKLLGYIATFILTISIVVLVHELGHFLMARKFNMPVRSFSIGFGNVLWQRRYFNTNFQVRLLPIGGFVDLDLSSNYPLWQRSLVTLAGPVISIILGVILLWVSLMIGLELQKPLIAEVQIDSPAAFAEMQAGEVVTAINDNTVSHWGEAFLWLLRDIQFNGYMKITTIDNKNIQHEYKLSYNLSKLPYKKNPIEKLGIIPFKAKNQAERQANLFVFKLDMYQALVYTISFTSFLITMTFLLIYKLVTGLVSMHMLTGPIGIAFISTKAFLAGLGFYLYLLATLSTHFAALNLFPIPGLDGAQLLYDFIEKTRGKMISPAVQELLRNLSIAGLIILTGLVLSLDIDRFLMPK